MPKTGVVGLEDQQYQSHYSAVYPGQRPQAVRLSRYSSFNVFGALSIPEMIPQPQVNVEYKTARTDRECRICLPHNQLVDHGD